MGLNDELKKRAGADLFGVADARAYDEKAPAGHRAADLLPGARSIVIIGTRLLDAPLDGIPRTRPEYTADMYIANEGLNRRLFELARFLQSEGHTAFPVPYTEMPGWNLRKRSAASIRMLRHIMFLRRVRGMAEKEMWGNVSFRHAAVEAGLGELGHNNLLLTPEHGARVRMVALLTGAELPAGEPRSFGLCRPRECGYACAHNCPAGALSETGEPTRKAECLKHYIDLGIPGMSGLRCGLCVAVCPAYRIGTDGLD